MTSFNPQIERRIIAATDQDKKDDEKTPPLQSPTSSTASGSTP
jgi:hypothetical protein